LETVLVTGAAGTVGNYVVGVAEAAGYRVIASDLRVAGIRMPVRGEIRAGDIRDPETVARLVEGADHVIHTAAQLDSRASHDELEETNTDAVVRLYDAARAAGARRFVHMSTAMLYQEGQSGPLTETALVAPRGKHGASKQGAEEFLFARDQGPAWTVLRAAPLYGRRGRHFAASLLSVGPIVRLLCPVLPRMRGGPDATMVHAEDVARALVFVLGRDDTERQVYNVADEDPMPLGDRLSETFRAYGLPTVPTGQMPRAVVRQLGHLFQGDLASRGADAAVLNAWRLVVARYGLKPALRPRLEREAISLLSEDLIVDSTKLRALGWRPRYPRFAEGFRQVLRWYQAENWVPRYA